MNYMDIKWVDTINGEGLRISIFTAGCTIHCKGCFNPQSWDFNAGKPFTQEVREKIYDKINNSGYYYQGISILGGEPTEHCEELLDFINEFRERCPGKDIWIWTGRSKNQIKFEEDYHKLIKACDVAVVGPFVEDLKDLRLKFRGSSNQEIINVKDMED